MLSIRTSKETVIQSGLVIFKFLYAGINTSLEDQRVHMYSKMAVKRKVNPARMPPTAGAATEHTLRSYLQYRDWALLKVHSLDPEEYGWMKSKGLYEPIPTKDAVAPDCILKFICCNCKPESNNACGTRRCSCI